MMNAILRLGLTGLALMSNALMAQSIYWYSPAAENLTSGGAPMTSAFRFELGIFSDGFVPTADNMDQWVNHWVPAQRSSYRPDVRRFDRQFTVNSNLTPWLPGTMAYIWGFHGQGESAEWILFRNDTWVWPAASTPPAPTGMYWSAASATAVIGRISNNGGVFQMQSAKVTHVPSPPVSWGEWQGGELADSPRRGPLDDADHDGSTNLEEYALGTDPKGADSRPAVAVTRVGGRMRMTVPRYHDRPGALVLVEASSDLTHWAPASSVISDTPAGLVVEDAVEMGPEHPRRFMRLRIDLPNP